MLPAYDPVNVEPLNQMENVVCNDIDPSGRMMSFSNL